VETEKTISTLLEKKKYINDRIKFLTTTTPIKITTFPIGSQTPLFEGVNLITKIQQDVNVWHTIKTLNKRVDYIFDVEQVELSTGETYNLLIEKYEDERAKDKTAVIQNLSKVLGGKDNKVYYKSKKTDSNGKYRYGKLSWKNK